MSEFQYDVIVIGTGPAGESAAVNAAKHGKRVAVIEDRYKVGGNCTHKGTIPSKALRYAVNQIIDYRSGPLCNTIADTRVFDLPKVMDYSFRVVDTQVEMRSNFYSRNLVDVYRGHASFIDEHLLRVETSDDEAHTVLQFEHAVIATGSRPFRPSDVDFDHPRIYDADKILDISSSPRTIIVYGAGVIGCEYASIFAGLDIKVELINNRERLLSFLDDEISDALSYHLSNSFNVRVRHNETYDRIEATDSGVTLHLKSGKRIRADALLWANGRSGNTENLGLENIGLEANNRGQLHVDEHYRTAVPHIYAAGDVIGWPSLASAAYGQGRATCADMFSSPEFKLVDEVPTGIYTIPEISSLGATERELTEQCRPYEVGVANFKETARAQITGDTVGMLKLLFDPDTHELLGIHCFGDQASEIVHIGQAIMNQPSGNNLIDYFVNTTFNYPTRAETYRTAALNGLNRVAGLA
ncbi:Si-specific NAD(P)(+) transhydrogenase [Carnimonas nigrificans]|uniref:Si-specific NAD(P)(+) transhydrogenase n=1 Tax=Carnimonas nigrificans TaxID=64323 RepID=UPI00046F3F9E|nr:Si-specific NAD(P)(+) transhydrogenase [Carnimonas nigrificans]